MRSLRLIAFVSVFACRFVRAELPEASSVIQVAELNSSRPYFIPTHPRVTTTIRFPKEIGAPDGAVAVFTEDAAKQAGEYLVTWQQGDSYFTITPLKEARMANLNVPYQGETFVLYFYQAAEPLKAVASVNLVNSVAKDGINRAQGTANAAEAPVSEGTIDVARQTTSPEDRFLPATTARLVGFLDRLKLIHATPPGSSLAGLVKTMNVEVAIAHEELARGKKDLQGLPVMDGVAGEIPSGFNDAGLFQIVLLRAVRERRINCVGFICLIRNTSKQVLAFDVKSFGARAGAVYLSQRISDAMPILKPGEQAPAYFIVHPDRNAPLLAANDWRISVDLVSPRLNPGAAIA